MGFTRPTLGACTIIVITIDLPSTYPMRHDKYQIDKLTAVIIHLEAATLLLLRNESHEAVHTLLSAARTVIWDLAKAERIEAVDLFDEAIENRIRPEKRKEWRFYQNRAANFFKHADRDPYEKLEGVNLRPLNEMDLLILTIVVGQISKRLNPRLAIALSYAGFCSGDWFDFRAYTSSVAGNTFDYDFYAGMPAENRRSLFLSAFNELPASKA